MLELKLLSLLIGSLGFQATVMSGWLRWQQEVVDKQLEEEEETLTTYESKHASSEVPQSHSRAKPAKDPHLSGWEFKIVRATRDIFQHRAVFKRLCDEEAQAGWILLEKLDDRRVRFKRPIALREIMRSDHLPVDPYRTHYGSSSNPMTLVWAIAFLAALVLPAYLGYMLVSTTLAHTRSPQSPKPTNAIAPVKQVDSTVPPSGQPLSVPVTSPSPN